MNVIDRIYEVNKSKGSPGLERIGRLLMLLGNPEKHYKVIHVAGTNGKGSVCHFLRSILCEAGYNVGMFTSPHISCYNERIQVGYDMIPDDDFERIANRVMDQKDILCSEGYGNPSIFEILTATAYVYFAEQGVDYMVSEVGIGGRIDSTNTVEKPAVCVITQIGMDHTEMLGDTLEKVAFEKAGIIKPGVTVVTESYEPEVEAVIRKRAAELGSKVVSVNDYEYRMQLGTEAPGPEGLAPCLRQGDGGAVPLSLFDVISKGSKTEEASPDDKTDHRDDHPGEFRIKMLGEHQVRNAIAAMLAIRNSGIDVTEEQLKAGLYKAVNPGRFEVLDTDPYFVIDGAHNDNGIRASIKAFKDVFGPENNKKTIILFGCFKDKDYRGMIDMISEAFRGCTFIGTEPVSERALDADEVSSIFEENGCECLGFHDARAAYESLKNMDYDIAYCLGSIYLISEIREMKRKEDRNV